MRDFGCGHENNCFDSKSERLSTVLYFRTTPPDEIIAVLDRGGYNKHHLPTHFGRFPNKGQGPYSWGGLAMRTL